MKKKVLGDDPFQPKGAKPAPQPAPVNKTKRAPNRKTQAPKATKKMAAPKTVSDVAPVIDAVPAMAPVTKFVTVSDSVAVAVTEPVVATTTEPPADSWRGWRFRQLQLARAEEAAFLTSRDPNADRFGRDPILAGRAEPVVDFVYRSLLRVAVRGLGHLPETGRAILVARRRRVQSPHGLIGRALDRLERMGLPSTLTATLDAALIAHAVRTEHIAHRELRPLVRPARLYTPFFGPLLRRLGGVSADVHDLARLLDDERLALALVDDRATPGSLDLTTIVCIALVTGAPVIPVKLGPTQLTKKGSTTLEIATPMFIGAEFGPEGAEDEALVARLTAELDAQL